MRTKRQAEGKFEASTVHLGASFGSSGPDGTRRLQGDIQVRFVQLVLPGFDDYVPARHRTCRLDIVCTGIGTLESLEATLLQALRDTERAMGQSHVPDTRRD